MCRIFDYSCRIFDFLLTLFNRKKALFIFQFSVSLDPIVPSGQYKTSNFINTNLTGTLRSKISSATMEDFLNIVEQKEEVQIYAEKLRFIASKVNIWDHYGISRPQCVSLSETC